MAPPAAFWSTSDRGEGVGLAGCSAGVVEGVSRGPCCAKGVEPVFGGSHKPKRVKKYVGFETDASPLAWGDESAEAPGPEDVDPRLLSASGGLCFVCWGAKHNSHTTHPTAKRDAAIATRLRISRVR